MEKLRKALEKVKKEVEEEKVEIGPKPQTQEQPVTVLSKVSPAYTQSQIYEVDPLFLIDNHCIGISSESMEIEFYKMLRTRIIQKTEPNGWNTIMITSALPGEGKTLTAINLALTFSREFNHTVLLIDCDLRQQKIHKMMGLPGERGLLDALVDNRPLQEIIVWPGIEKLTVISGGNTITESSEILSSPKMKSLVSEIKSRYSDRYIFFDVPPILSAADAVAFSPMVDSILMVVQASKTSIQDIKKACDLIPREKFLGFVLNRHKIPTKSYGEYYYRKVS